MWNVPCREEEFSIKMVTADDETTIDIVVQGDEEEITRMTKELQLREKGMVYVPGLLEGSKARE
jgi:acylphosphatase